MKALLLALGTLLALSACTPAIQVQAPPVNVPMALPAQPRPVATEDVPWTVTKQDDEILVCTTPEGFESLAGNVREMLRFIEQQNSIIEFYKNSQEIK